METKIEMFISLTSYAIWCISTYFCKSALYAYQL